MSFLLKAIILVASTIINIYFFIVIIAALITWVSPDPYNPIVQILRRLTEPVFRLVRRVLPFVVIQGVDLSPVVVLIVLQVAQQLLWELRVMVAQ
ncbi:MAG: YggT family protein [Desulfovibrio sp.]|nr:MAG: YggT family protein [Desulfovibrio sp.]